MTVLIDVTVDLDDTEALEEHGSLENGVYGIDEDGVYHMYHHNKTYLVKWDRIYGSPDEDPEYGKILMENIK